MFNLQRYSCALLVLVFHIRTLTALPFEVQPVLVAQPQLDVGVALPSSNVPAADGIAVETRSLNTSDNNPSLRSLPNLNASDAANPVARSLPNPADAIQHEDISARNGFSNQPVAPAAAAPVGLSDSQDQIQQRFGSAPVQTNVSQAAPAFRSGFDGSVSNVSKGEPAVAAANLPEVAIAARAANATQTEPRALDLNASPAQSKNISNGNPFVPSFLQSFGLRQKRREEGDTAAEAVDVKVEQPAAFDNSPAVIERINVEQAVPLESPEGSAAASQLNLNIAPNNPQVPSRMEMIDTNPSARFPGNVPYINVYPVDDVEF